MEKNSKPNGFAVSMATVILIAFAVAGWYTKTNYSGMIVSQIIWRFFIFLMGAVGALIVPWMGLYYIVSAIFEKGKTWLWLTLCFAVMIVAYLVTP